MSSLVNMHGSDPLKSRIGDDLFIGPLGEEEREGSMVFSNHFLRSEHWCPGPDCVCRNAQIKAGEELKHDWAMTDNDDYEMECHCGTPNCRKIITGQEWRRRELQERYQGFVSSYLQTNIAEES
jgi:hypothetical protein